MSTPDAVRLAADLETPGRVFSCGAVAAELRRQHLQNMELLRWKSVHAPRLWALEGLLRQAQREAAAGREAIANLASLDSERQANAMLTAEVERLTAECESWASAVRDMLQAHDKGVQWIKLHTTTWPAEPQTDMCTVRDGWVALETLRTMLTKT